MDRHQQKILTMIKYSRAGRAIRYTRHTADFGDTYTQTDVGGMHATFTRFKIMAKQKPQKKNKKKQQNTYRPNK